MSNFPMPKKRNDFLSSTYNIKEIKIRPFVVQDFSIKPFKIVPKKRNPTVSTFDKKHIHVKEENKVEKFPEVKANNDFNNKLLGIPKRELPNEDNVLYHEYKLKGLDSSDFVISKMQEEAGTSNQITTSNRMKETGESKEEAVKSFMELYASKKGIDVAKPKPRPKITIERAVKEETKATEAKEVESDSDDEDFTTAVSSSALVKEYIERQQDEDEKTFMSYFKGLKSEDLKTILSEHFHVSRKTINKSNLGDLVKLIMEKDVKMSGVKGLIEHYEHLSKKYKKKSI
jgi:hypothetical protein